MPRNGSGTYSLPAGNPVVSGTTIQASWANSTLADISTELTGSLARSGAGGMLGALRGVDGTVSVPAFSFTSETTAGFYRAGTGDVRFAMAGADVYTVTSTGVGIGTSSPGVKLEVSSTSAGATVETLRLSNPGAGANTQAQIKFFTTSTNYGTISGGYGASAPQMTFDLPNGTPGNYVWQISSSEKMRLDSSGNLGLGVAPGYAQAGWNILQCSRDATFGGVAGGPVYGFMAVNAYPDLTTDPTTATWGYRLTGSLASRYDQNAGQHRWFTAPSGTAGSPISFTQAMTLTSGGEFLVGTTNASVGTAVGCRIVDSGARLEVAKTATTNADIGLSQYSTGAGAYRFYVGYGGTVYATSTTITAISDQRLKENIRDLDVGLDKIMALKPRKFDWKPGKGKDKKGDRGWIAQEFEQVFPDMVDTWQDPAPEGEEPYKAVNADLIPVLVKAIQEQQAIIEDLRARVAALEAA